MAILAVTTTAVSQPASESAADEESRIIETIAQEQAQNGEYSENLVEPLSDLAALYQDRGDNALAVVAFEHVLRVIRANDGVYSLDQAPLFRRWIAAEESLGNAEAAWDLEQRLLAVARRHPDDLRTVPIYRDSAEKRVAFLNRYLAGEPAPQIKLGCYLAWNDPASPCTTGNRDDAVRAVIADAQRNYADAIVLLLGEGLYSSAELRALETGLLRSIGAAGMDSLRRVRTENVPWRGWVEAMEQLAAAEIPNPSGLPLEPGAVPLEPRAAEKAGTFDYQLGRESLVRLFRYELAASAPLGVQIEAFLRVADWDLVHARNALALDEYAQVYRLLAERGAPPTVDEIFAPAVPVVLPAYSPNTLATSESASAGYVDVAFEVTQFGESRHVKIIDASANATDAERDRLATRIKATRFRPRSSDGEPARAAPVAVRYYLHPAGGTAPTAPE